MQADMPHKLDRNVSVYLDFLRFAAAMVVFMTHTHTFLLPSPKIGPLGWGREAVAVFFVLSGFVIAFVVRTKETRWQDYAVARLVRILPVAALAIAVTIVADAVGTAVNPAYYDLRSVGHGGFYVPASWPALASYLTFTNQVWSNHAVFGTNEPYWSLGFEFQYYLMFMLWCFLPRRLKWPGVLAWAWVAGPKLLMYLPVWLLGVLVYRWMVRTERLSLTVAALSIVGATSGFLVLKFVADRAATNMYERWPIGQEAVNFLYFNAVGILVAILLVATIPLIARLPHLNTRIASAIRWLAGASFTLYLTHQPLVFMFSAILNPVQNYRVASVSCALLTLVTCFTLAELAERRKKWFASAARTVIGYIRVVHRLVG
jgi:peptidoglycan/LPS O-acetylase OafA/YrhL